MFKLGAICALSVARQNFRHSWSLHALEDSWSQKPLWLKPKTLEASCLWQKKICFQGIDNSVYEKLSY